MIAKGAKASPGDFAENITKEGIELFNLSLGCKL
jgi:MOSC domain-containing protein YiiM